MREVLRRYAATGRTVVVSSHLLSEVEQTCTHVVIVSGGRTIAAGTVAELVAHSGELAITTTQPDRARAALAGLAGVGDTDTIAGGLVVDRRSVPVEAIMRALLGAGVPVSAIGPRNRLEEVFLSLVAAGPGGRA
jgi:ABC-2 type transport system ATP-binding protein